MNKKELVSLVSKQTNLSSVQARSAVNSVLSIISSEIDKGEKFSLAGFGRFVVKEHAAKVKKDPKTGKEVKRSARQVIRFQPASKDKNRSKKS